MDRTLNENRANPTDPWMVNYLAYRRSLLGPERIGARISGSGGRGR